MPKFNKGDRVRVRLTSHSLYRGQIGVVDDNPSSSTGSRALWYSVRFKYKGLHPAVRLTEEDLEAVTGEITSEETSPEVKITRRSRRESGNQVARVSSRRKYYFITLAAVVVLAGILIGFILTGGNDESTAPTEFSSGQTSPVLTGGSSNQTMKLEFAAELVEATAGLDFPVQPVVKIVDANGDVVTTSTAPVSLAVTNNRAELYGTTTVNAVNGVATFTDLTIIYTGTNYSLSAISPGMTSSLSNPFDVAPGEGVSLDYISEPYYSGLPSHFSVRVVVRDEYGNIDNNSTAEVTVSIAEGSGTPGAVLSGTTTKKAENGLVSFTYLSIVPEDSSYKLTATSPGLVSTTSSSFNVEKLTENQEE
jgi:hypothetical protein